MILANFRCFVILKVSRPVLKSTVRKVCDEYFHCFCVIHKIHEKIWPQKFGAIYILLLAISCVIGIEPV